LRKLVLVACLVGLCLLASSAAFAQGGDVAIGFSSLIAPSSSSASGQYSPQTIGGGLYPSFSLDFLIRHRLGVEGEISWRGSQNLYGGYEPFRPIFYNINGIWSPKLGDKVGAELLAGIGATSVRFYTGTYNCNFVSCTDYNSINHFMGVLGAGLKYYVHGHIFVRPEVRLYLIHNDFEFSSGRAVRAGASIGYSF
jgi:opacity protein-like surface antigen